MKYEAKGTLTEKGVDINYSTILSKLIKLAGKHCDSYASDLFIDWSSLTERMKNPCYEGEVMLFGFRDLGVDGKSYVSRFLDDEESFKDRYVGGVWMLTIEVKSSNWSKQKDVDMTLEKVSYRELVKRMSPIE